MTPVKAELMTVLKCQADGCERQPHAKGYCKPHYLRLHRHGSPYGGSTYRSSSGEGHRFLNDALRQRTEACIEWPFGKTSNGYGMMWVDRKLVLAHRASCEAAHGAPPSEKHQAAHNCGNRVCINPSHLRWATAKENHADKAYHGTRQNGENNGFSKLTEKQVAEIRAEKGLTSQRKLAGRFGVSQRQIGRILNGASWT